MKKIRLIVAFFPVAALVLSLSACTGSSQNLEKEETVGTEMEKKKSEQMDLPDSETEVNSAVLEQLPVEMEAQNKWMDVDSLEASGHDWSILNDSYLTLASASCDGIYVKKEGYEKMNEALTENNHLSWERICGTWNTIGDNIYEFVEGQGESSIYSLPWTLENSIRLERADNRVVSFVRSRSDYLGGAHPGYETRAYNYEAQSGKLLALNDVVADCNEIYRCAGEKLQDNKDLDIKIKDLDTFINDYFSDPSEVVWCFTQSGIEIIFPAGSVGVYMLGPVYAELPYEEIRDILQEEYIPVTKQSCIYVEPYEEISSDFDRDGTEEILSVSYEQKINEEYNYPESVVGKVTLVKDGIENSVTENVGLEYLGSYLMQSEEGGYYLYMESSWENDWHTISVFDLNQGSPVFLGTSDVGGFYDMTPFDAGDFYVSKRLNMMGTWEGFQKCRVGNDGFPEPLEKDYRIWRVSEAELFDSASAEENYGGITLKQDLKAYSYQNPEKPEEGAEKVIQAGTKLTPYRTDGENRMTFQTEEGIYIDVIYDAADPDAWERTIQGMEEYDLFDGIMYAG